MNDIPVRTTAGRTARRLADHPSLRRLARAGFAASGLIHLMLGWIAGRAAVGGGGEADQDGALAALRAAPAGSVILWACVVGFLALALWQQRRGRGQRQPDGRVRWATSPRGWR